MEQTANYEVIDLERWERRDHFRYYMEKLPVEINVTVPVRVEGLLAWCHKHDRRFYAMLICLVTRAVNHTENLRFFRGPDGALCRWKRVVPNYTIFHADDHTFSDCWSEESEDLEVMYRTVTADMERFRDVKGIKARPGQPANFFCVSCAPWISFTGYSSRVLNGAPQFFPVITAGKYEKHADGTVSMPLNLTIAHAVCDGYHIGRFFECLQAEIDRYREP